MSWRWLENWHRASVQLLEVLCGGAVDSATFAATLATGGLVLLLMLNVFGRSCEISNRGIIRRLIGGVLGAGSALAVTTAGMLWVIPHVGMPAVRIALLVVLPIAGIAVVGTPLAWPVFRAAYSSIVIALVASLGLAVLAMLLMTALIESVATGDRQSQALKDRAESLESIMNP